MQSMLHKADIHIHTTYSDGMASVRSVLEHTAGTELRLIAITDHDTMAGAYEAQSLMHERHYPFELILGEEVSTADGHVLALYIEEPIRPGMSIEATIGAIHAQGGLAIAAHPFGKFVDSVGRKLLRYARGSERHWHFDALETLNASLWDPDDNAAAAVAAKTLGIPACGGSDSHSLPTIGMGYTLFAGQTAEDFRAAMVAGHVSAGGRRWPWAHMRAVAGEFLRRDVDRVLRRTVARETSGVV